MGQKGQRGQRDRGRRKQRGRRGRRGQRDVGDEGVCIDTSSTTDLRGKEGLLSGGTVGNTECVISVP